MNGLILYHKLFRVCNDKIRKNVRWDLRADLTFLVYTPSIVRNVRNVRNVRMFESFSRCASGSIDGLENLEKLLCFSTSIVRNVRMFECSNHFLRQRIQQLEHPDTKAQGPRLQLLFELQFLFSTSHPIPHSNIPNIQTFEHSNIQTFEHSNISHFLSSVVKDQSRVSALAPVQAGRPPSHFLIFSLSHFLILIFPHSHITFRRSRTKH